MIEQERSVDKAKYVLIACFMMASVVSASPIDVNLLENPGFEDGLTDWSAFGDDPHGELRTGSPAPHSGQYYLFGGIGNSYACTAQTVNLIDAGFSAGELDSGMLSAHFGGWQAGWENQDDQGKIEILFYDTADEETGMAENGWFYSNNNWTLLEQTVSIPTETRSIVYKFHHQRRDGNNNDAYLDDAFLNIVPEPATIGLLAPGGLCLLRRKSKCL